VNLISDYSKESICYYAGQVFFASLKAFELLQEEFHLCHVLQPFLETKFNEQRDKNFSSAPRG